MSWFSKSLFIFILIFSSIMGISMNSLLLTWGFMEMNFLAFIPLISLEKNMNPHMLGLKYFLIQALGSILLLVAYIYMMNLNNFFVELLYISILWKVGLPPFHFWFFSLSMDLNWMMFLILNSWQKILPFYIMSKVYLQNWELMVVLSLLISLFGSLFQSSIKKLLIFSSIFMGAWIMVSMIYFTYIWIYVLLIYSLLLMTFIMFLNINKFELKESQNYFILNLSEKFIQFMVLLTMAGVPPFVGFFIKMMILVTLISTKNYFMVFILVVCSIILTYMYTSVFLVSMSMQNSNNKMMCSFKIMPLYTFTIFFILYGSLMILIL